MCGLHLRRVRCGSSFGNPRTHYCATQSRMIPFLSGKLPAENFSASREDISILGESHLFKKTDNCVVCLQQMEDGARSAGVAAGNDQGPPPRVRYGKVSQWQARNSLERSCARGGKVAVRSHETPMCGNENLHNATTLRYNSSHGGGQPKHHAQVTIVHSHRYVR